MVETSVPGPVASRADLRRRLAREPGLHLVFVHYDDKYTVHDEWVYNAADLTTAPVVLAHDLGREHNRLLIADYPGRRLWLATVSAQSKTLSPYPDDAPYESREHSRTAAADDAAGTSAR
jgi:hypothetical protein